MSDRPEVDEDKLRAELDRWLKERGKASGTRTEWMAHVATLVGADPVKFAASQPRRPDDGYEQVHVDHATVRDFLHHARIMSRRAKTKTQRAEADRMMTAAETARERAGGNLDIRVRDISDQVWPASETRQ